MRRSCKGYKQPRATRSQLQRPIRPILAAHSAFIVRVDPASLRGLARLPQRIPGQRVRLGRLPGIVNGEAKLSNPSKSSWGHGLVSKQSRKPGIGARGAVSVLWGYWDNHKAGQSAAQETIIKEVFAGHGRFRRPKEWRLSDDGSQNRLVIPRLVRLFYRPRRYPNSERTN